MKNIISILVAVIGVVCVVFGVLFIVQSNSSRATLVDELKVSNVTLDTLDSAYNAAKDGLSKALAAGTAGAESAQSAGWQKAALSAAKSSRGTIDFVQMSGILTIVIGAGFVLAGAGLMKKS
jgi:hypothetical protein